MTLALLLASIGLSLLAVAGGRIVALAASGLGLAAAVAALLAGDVATLSAAWPVPLGRLAVGVDPLSAFFLVCVHLVAFLAALAGGARPFFNMLVAAVGGVVLARDGVLFLVAWEVMSLAGFFLLSEGGSGDTRAGVKYLVAAHLGVVCLFVLFGLLAGRGDFAFAALAPGDQAGACFLLALAGFGAKAGFWPLHVWLPDAYAAAPSHGAALMSGAMSKMGIYGLLRVASLLGPPAPWWGPLLIGVGAASALAGILGALAQTELRRVVAYSSVENLGIVALGLGLGLVGRSQGVATLAWVGTAGALLHVLNHGLMKGLLFHGSGAVERAAGTGRLDALGGLARRMPVTAAAVLVGAAAIVGLPPLNGFAGEWLLYVAALRGAGELPAAAAAFVVAVPAVLALAGGIAVAAFVRAYGVAFLGAPRTEAAAAATEAPRTLRAAMIAGAALCVAIGLWPAGALALIAPVASQVVAAPEVLVAVPSLSVVGGVLVALALFLVVVRRALLRGREVTVAPTWGCGYPAPTARMQYTAASFQDPLLEPFAPLVHRRVDAVGPDGIFPARASYAEEVGDVAGDRVLGPAMQRLVGALARLRVIQQGRVQLYLTYVLVTLIVLLVWQLR